MIWIKNEPSFKMDNMERLVFCYKSISPVPTQDSNPLSLYEPSENI